ncbi:MAG: ComEC/Rec2 family competence protein [Patescibacteria group bacterium]|jgi:competence protein ComEC
MSKSKIFLLASLIFLLSNLLYLLYFENKGNHSFGYDFFYTFTATVVKVDKKLDGYNIVVQPEELVDFSGKILLYHTLYPEYYYGDILEISCKIYKPEKILAEDGQTFAYDKYLAKDDIFGTCFRPHIKTIGQSKNLTFYIYQARHYFWQNLNDYLVEPSSALAKAMFLSPQREISDDFWAIFAKVGVSHMISISGSHMVIIIWLAQSFLIALGFSRKSAFWFLVIFLLFYLYLIGFISPAVRSAAMAIILLSGPFLGRNTDSVYSLFLAADILVTLNPYIILYDIGFQLSFLAVLGLVYYARFFNKVLVFIPQQFKLREVVAVTLASQIFTWPITVYNFGIFSIIAPVANLLILPFLPVVLILSMALSVFGFWAFLAELIAWPLFISLKIIVDISEWLSKIPYAFVYINGFSLVYLFLSLFFMCLITIILNPRSYE